MMGDTGAANNRIIARNTIMLYVRMLLSIVVSLYTSRVVLQTLGVDDYGIYGIVGGIVSMFSFLNASMSGATSRFITYALGKGDMNNVRETFSTAIIVHIGIALVIMLLAETVGLWLLEKKLVIPEGRMNAARIVYQFSILAMAVQVTQVPYNASIISYEKMDVYAYVELFNVFLKLAIVYVLVISSFDKLILYSILVFSVNILIAITYRLYCIRHFDTCRVHWAINRKKLIPMLSFSGWDLYGNMCYSIRQQGINVLINMFYGVAFNAASSIASSIQGIISGLSANVIQAFRPQIVKNYSQDKISEMQDLMANALKYTLLLFLLIAVPAFLEMESIMYLWLGEVPKYASSFCRVMLCISMLNLINNILCIAIGATGNVKNVSFISGSIYLLSIPIIYILFRYFVNNAIYAYLVSFFILLFVVVVNFCIVRKQIPTIHTSPIIKSCAKALLIAVISIVPAIIIIKSDFQFILEIVFVCIIYAFTLAIMTLLCDKQIRVFIVHKLLRRQ